MMNYTIFDYLVSTKKLYRTSLAISIFILLFGTIIIGRTILFKNPGIENSQLYSGVLTDIGFINITSSSSALFDFNKKVDKPVLKITLDKHKDFYLSSGYSDYWETIEESMIVGKDYQIDYYEVLGSEKILKITTNDQLIFSSEELLTQMKEIEFGIFVMVILNFLFILVLFLKRKKTISKTTSSR